MSELNLILLGPPGAGKGTQAALLTEDFGLPHVATGDMLRAAREAQTELGLLAEKYMDAGDLVPDAVVIGVILERLGDDDARDGFLLDGFPRTIEQAVYHVDLDPPKHTDRCDIDGSELEQRDDDLEETVRRRLEVYHEQTEPLIAYYDERGLLRRFDGVRSPTQVHAHIRATLATLRLEEDL